MLYRRSPITPPKLLLRIVAGAGVGTLVGVAACSSSGAHGLAPTTPSETADASDNDAPFLGCEGVCGFVLDQDACTVENGCEPVGSLRVPPEAGEPDGDADAGPATDAASDAASDASSGDGSTGPCNPVCGIIVTGLVVHPDE
jgi:hypothetical protein